MEPLEFSKDESAGRSVVFVNPAYTSQICRGCGFNGHADVLAAMNIRDRGQGLTSLDRLIPVASIT